MIPLSAPDISSLELAYVAQAVESTLISSTGPFVDRFEAAWARICGVDDAISVANGTAALAVAMQALGVRPGDEVIVPAFTFAAVASAVVVAGGRPVFVDVDADTWCIDPAAVASAVTARTVGVIAVHAYGHPAPMDELARIATSRGLWMLEDGAEAHLATIGGRTVGGLGDAAAFSFFGNKIVAAGEGGAVTTSDPVLAARIRTLANQGVAPGAPDRYSPVAIGTNLRLTNVACALLCAQLERRDVLLARRRSIEATYRSALAAVDLGWMRPAAGVETVPWLVTVLVADRDRVIADLARRGVQARRSFPALPDLVPHRQPADVPVARTLAATGVSLPTHPGMTEDDLAVVSTAMRAACQPVTASVR